MATSQLLSSFGKQGEYLGLLTQSVDIEDTSYLSKYFVFAEYNPLFTAGRNPVSFNGSSLIKNGTEIKVECLDSAGNSLYIEHPVSSTQFVDVAPFVISVHIYNETYNGPGKLVLVGTTIKNEIVRWIGNITIDKTLQNSAKVRFYTTPTLEARLLLYPVIANDSGTQLTKEITFTGSMYAYAANPVQDTNQTSINTKTTDIDYRINLFASSPFPPKYSDTLYPTLSFNSQMEGQPISIVTSIVKKPYSNVELNQTITGSFTIKKVINSVTAQLDNAFFYNTGKDQIMTDIPLGVFTAPYKWIAYNTHSDAYQKVGHPSIYIKQSYAEIIYKNIKPFSGFVARHKLYRKSLLFPGDFQLIADETLGANEILTDPVTLNKTYPLLGTFYNQNHINKYWFPSSNKLQLSHSVYPYIDSMKIYASPVDNANGENYVIAKMDTLNIVNDAIYRPYNEIEFNEQSGSSYTSNFIDLKEGTLYALTMNVIMEKVSYNTDAKIQFFFTSSIPSIIKEKDYIFPFGLKLGEISTADLVSTKIFNDTQTIYFTPNDDYYGTLVIVPYQCNVTLSKLSLKVYGDYGFSPDILFTKIPFPINVANETFQLKAELYDINSTLVYSNLQTIQSFDPNGESLYTYIDGPLPNIRLLGYIAPTQDPPKSGEGITYYTDITNLSLTGSQYDYVQVNEIIGSTEYTATPLSVRYNSTQGKRISIDSSGNKIVDQ